MWFYWKLNYLNKKVLMYNFFLFFYDIWITSHLYIIFYDILHVQKLFLNWKFIWKKDLEDKISELNLIALEFSLLKYIFNIIKTINNNYHRKIIRL